MRPRPGTSATPVNGSASRKRNHEESEEEDETQYSQFQPGELRSITSKTSCNGVVERLYLRNFMCHDALEVTFNPRVNFVVGRNGSGKSAILLALVVGLGGKASATNRGSSLKDFVKKGEKSALVEVTLNNSGLYPYKAELYGERITVVRTIVAAGGTGAGYKIKSATGAVVSTKREDLVRLLESLKIQVDNPVAVLNQDTSRNFLNSSEPGDKYTLFMRATQMDVVDSEHNKAVETRCKASAAVNEKEQVLEQQEQTRNELRARFKALKSVPKQRARIDHLENQIVWAQVVDKEAELAAAEAAVAAESRKCDDLRREAEGHGTQDAEMKEQHGALKQQLAEVRQNLAAQEARFADAKVAHSARKEAALAAQRDVRTHTQHVQRQKGNVAALRQEIARLEQSTGPDYMARRAEQREKTARCEEQLAQAQAALQTSELHMAQLRDNEEPLREQIHALRTEQNETQRRVDGLERELNSLSRSSNALSLYGAHAVPLQSRIDAAVARGEFSCAPVGPLGQHVRLRDGNANWACAIEQQLGGHLQSYLVNSAQDRKKLFDLMTEVIGNRRKPTIINSRFQEQKHDTTRNQVKAPNGSKALIDVIVVDNVQAFNTLVDQAQIEKVLLIPTQELALAMMKRAETVPRNCARGVLPTGDIFYPAPDFRTYAGQRRYTARYLQVSAADRIRPEPQVRNDILANNEREDVPNSGTPVYVMNKPGPSKYKNINRDTRIPAVTEKCITLFLKRFGKTISPRTRSMYEEKYLRSAQIAEDPSSDGAYLSGVCATQTKRVFCGVDVKISADGNVAESQCECQLGTGPHARCGHVTILLLAAKDVASQVPVKIAVACPRKVPAKRPYDGSPVKCCDLKVRKLGQPCINFDPRPPELRNNAGYSDFVHNLTINYAANVAYNSGSAKKVSMPIMQLIPPANQYAIGHDHTYASKLVDVKIEVGL